MISPNTNWSGRLESGDFNLHEISDVNGKGLDILTRAISSSTDRIAEPQRIASVFKTHAGQDIDIKGFTQQKQNKVLAALVRDVWVTTGWVAAYESLVTAIPLFSLHSRLFEDVKIAVDIYSRLKEGECERKSTDLKIHIGSELTYDDIHWVGPKYAEVLERPGWKDSRDSKGLSPCITYGWLGVATKMVPEHHFQKMAIMNLLGTVDYDLDEITYTKGGFESGFKLAARHAIEPRGELQIAAFAGLINHDFQTFVRPIQNEWVKQKKGSTNLGPKDVSPADWSALLVADCAALVPFGFETAEQYNFSRVGVTTGMLHQTCHDLLFDTGCSNRINTV
ncbi:hypothetical protein G6O67_004168 [Ophiocordyceps sinensis]|uniref:Uncharacterized protein n=1 Tax=Ophiocordyceps sinensis TaxID=72228 RepID=A0A8H4PML2_9HYPO|nr:hypothetical protein G6O67_004168 [Ophiocordyceps sinensis]